LVERPPVKWMVAGPSPAEPVFLLDLPNESEADMPTEFTTDALLETALHQVGDFKTNSNLADALDGILAQLAIKTRDMLQAD
jgi:hypothetical protein